jgi:hypothetical protein
MAVLVSCEEISPSTLSFPRTLCADSTSALCSSSLTRSLEDQDYEDQILFPPYDTVRYHGQVENLGPPARLWTGDSNTVSPTSTSTSTSVSRPESPVPARYAEDDTAVRIQHQIMWIIYRIIGRRKIFGHHGSILCRSG